MEQTMAKMKNPVSVPDNAFDRSQARRGLTVKNNSQMARMSEQGMSHAKAEKEDAMIRANLEDRLRRLNKLKGYMLEVQAQLSLLPTLEHHGQMQILTSAIKTVKALRDHPNLPVNSSKPLRLVCNELMSLREGVFASAKVDKHSLSVIQMANALEEIDNMIRATTNRISVVEGADSSEEYLRKLFERAKEIIRKSNNESRRLESIKHKPVVLDRVPIVPITTPPINTQKLDRLGVRSDNLGGYALLHSQLVIGINKEALKEVGKRGKLETPLQAAERYVAALEKTGGRKLHLVTTKAVPYGGGVWYWIADDHMINALMKAAGGQLKVSQWGFGMNSTTEG